MSGMTPEAQVEALKAALAEAGYPDAPVTLSYTTIATRPNLDIPEGEPRITTFRRPGDVDMLAATWRARAIVGYRWLRCWPCYRDGEPRCDHDWRTAEQPPVPERVS